MAAVGQTVTPSGLTGDGFVLALRDSRRGAVRFLDGDAPVDRPWADQLPPFSEPKRKKETKKKKISETRLGLVRMTQSALQWYQTRPSVVREDRFNR